MMTFLAPIIGFVAVVGPALVLRAVINAGARRGQLAAIGGLLAIVMIIGIVLSMGYSLAGTIGVLVGCGVLLTALAGAVLDATRGTVGTPISDAEAERRLEDPVPGTRSP